jgi:MFS family permease
MWAIIVIVPAVQAEFGTNRADASLPYTATMVGFALGNWLIGRVVDRFGLAVSLAGSAVLIAAGYTLASLAPTIGVLTLVQGLIGFGTSVAFGPLIADTSHWFLRHRGIAVGVAASGNYLAGAIWPTLLAGTLAEAGWRSVYETLAVITILAMLPLSLLVRRRVPEAGAATAVNARPIAAAGLSNSTLIWLLAVAGVGCCVAMSMPQVHIVALCTDLGYGPAVGSHMLSLMLLGGVVSRLISGLVADRLGGVRTLLIGSVLQMLALFLYLPAGGLVSLTLVSVVFGLSQGGIVPAYTLIVREYLPAREAGGKIGFVLMATIFGMAFGGWISGWIYDATGSYDLAFLNGIAFNGMNVAIMLLILSRSRPRPDRLAPV